MRWFDPLTERWIETRDIIAAPAARRGAKIPEVTAQSSETAAIWAAVEASARACQMGDAKGAPAEEE